MNDIAQDAPVRRGPGRPKFHETAAAKAIQPDPIDNPVAEATSLPGRPGRKPFGALEQKLAYPERPGFHRHWFNDVPGRLARALEAGYEHVKANGENVSRIVGSAEGGGALIAFLMEIPEEWFQADLAEQQKEVNAREGAIRRGEYQNQNGTASYVPTQGISIKHGR